MTREEAIRVLEDNRPSVIFEDKDAQKRMAELCQAIDMAIEALKANDEDEPQFYTEDDYWNGMFTKSAEAYKAWTGEEMGGTSERQKVAYICDKRRCDKEGCSNCGRTTDIEHAKNFELINNTYYERW